MRVLMFSIGLFLLSSASNNYIGAETVSYNYDDTGRLVEAVYGDKAITYVYDQDGNLLQRKIGPYPAAYVDASGTCHGYTPCYMTIQAAIAACGTGTTIMAKEDTYSEDLILNASKYLRFRGGWDSTFSAISSQAAANSLTIGGSGAGIEVDRLVLK